MQSRCDGDEETHEGVAVARGSCPASGFRYCFAIMEFVRPRCANLVLTALLVSAASSAAETTAPGFALSRFEPSDRGSRFFNLESLDWRTDGRPALGVVLDHAYKPLVVDAREDAGDAAVVRHQLLGHVGGSLNAGKNFRFGLNLPVVFYATGRAGQIGLEKYAPPRTSAAGDLRLSGDWRFFRAAEDRFVAGLGARAFLPTGDAGAYASDGKFRMHALVNVAGFAGDFVWAARAGAVLRNLDAVINGTKVGDEGLVAVALAYRALDGKLQIGPEAVASTYLGRTAFRESTTPIDVTLGVRYDATRDLRVGFGVGRGLTDAFGEPVVRGLASLEWSPTDSDPPPCSTCPVCPPAAETPPPPPPPPVAAAPGPADRDGDGIFDDVDACPFVPGVKSDDPTKHGCPLPPPPAAPPPPPPAPIDTDGDGILDFEDACPKEKGERHRDKEFNGCPEVVIAPVKFRVDTDIVLESSYGALETLRTGLARLPKSYRFRVEGHTDTSGVARDNLVLSRKRAAAIVRWLAGHGFDPARFDALGFGQDKPRVPNDTPEHRAENRRVEVHILAPDTKVSP
jgi:outer membrane protein OmpA-like peptidoglycan-associated protein